MNKPKLGFLELHENYLRRHQRGGFLVGDVFVFNKDYKSTDFYKGLNSDQQEHLQSLIDSGLNIRVVGIRNVDPGARFPGNTQTSSTNVVLDIALDQGGGRTSDHATVSVDMGTPDTSYYPNLPPVPDAQVRQNDINIKPKEVEEQDHISNKTDRGDGKLKTSEIRNPSKNTKIPSKPATKSPNGSSAYVADYMKGVK